MFNQRGKMSRTLMFTLVVVVLAVYVFVFEYRKGNQDEEKKAQDALIFNGFDLSQVTQIVVSPNFVNKDSDIKLEKKENKWHLTSPVKDLADQTAVETYISTLLAEKTQESLGHVEDLKTLGLDVPKGSVSIKKTDAEIQVNIGSVKAYDGSLYASVISRPGVQLVSSVWDSLITKKPNDFRSRRLERSYFEDWNRIATQINGRKNLELVKEGGDWQTVPKSEIPIDPELVKGFLYQMVTLEIKEFLAETKTDLTKFGLTSPSYELHLSGEKESKPVDYKLSLSTKNAAKDSANATSSDISSVAQVDLAILDVLKRPRESFYNRKFPFQYDVTQAARIKIQMPEVALTVVKKDGQWVKEQASVQREIVSAKFDDLAAALSRLEASHYLSEPGQGLLPIKNYIEVSNDKGELLTRVIWGSEYKPKSVETANVGLQYYYAQTSRLPKQVLSLKQHLIHDLELAKLFVQPATPTPTPEADATKESL